MRKSDVLSHFNSTKAVCKALGITKSAVSQWGDVIPEGTAYKLQFITGGILRVDPNLYPSASRGPRMQSQHIA